MRTPLIGSLATLMLALPLASPAGTRTDVAMRSWTIPASSGVLDMRILTGAGLRITGWDRDEVNVVSDWSEERCRDATVNVTRTARGVLVETRYPSGTRHRHCSFGIEVKVPRRFDVQLRSAGGSVGISGMRGDIRGQTGGGMLELAGLKGTVRLTTGGGGIVVRDSDLEGSLSTGGGRVQFDNVSGGVTGRSGTMRGVVRGRSFSI